MSDPGCPACHEPAIVGATYCEACGADLAELPTDPEVGAASGAPAAACAACEAPSSSIAADGYCGECGHKQPDPRDHHGEDLGAVAAVSDRGRRHHRNEDAFSVAAVGDAAVLVVCDGVSSTDAAHLASASAAATCRAHLAAAFDTGEALTSAIIDAVVASGDAVARTPGGRPGAAPSCTIVAAVARPAGNGTTQLSWGWLGDSRAYWMSPGGDVRQLTRDHVWGAEQVEAGAATVEEVSADPRASSITRWLGADAPETIPAVGEDEVPSGGLLLVCSDGLWNYAATIDAMAELLRSLDSETSIDLAEALCRYAVDAGGHDNVTVAVAHC